MNHSVNAAPAEKAGAGMTWAEREALLQRIGVELSFIAQGSDPKLDKILEQLRAALRHGSDTRSLASVADFLFQYLISEDGHAASSGDFVSLAVALQNLLEELQVPVANFSDAQRLTEAAGNAKNENEILAVLHRGVELLKDINQFVDDRPTGSAQPNKAGKSAIKASKEREPSWLNRIKRLGKDNVSAREIFDSLRPLLDRVLDKVATLDDASKQVVVIKAQLPTIKNPREMQKVLEQVLELLARIASGISSERKDTERFLGELREKLQGIEQGIVNSADTESLGRAEALHTEIGEQVNGIQEAVEQGDSLESMRKLIAQRVETIDGTLNHYLNAERSRHEDSEKRVKDLTRTVREMEFESQQLRAKVQEKQVAATRDPLTGATNRFGYDERVVEEFARSRRIGFPLSLVVLDIDHFKEVNDTFGHKAGDLVLQKVVEVMRQNVRKTDCIARYGGDEFVLLLPDTPAEGALIACEKLRAGVEACGFHNSGAPVKVTICCGITEVKDTDTPESAFDRADSAMYRVKKGHRNGCQISK